jgi:hypothetical protein
MIADVGGPMDCKAQPAGVHKAKNGE